ncbi:ABC transporter permease [Dongia deserti]|uniref:ABC transporter permease n=1 Tax=Dongia deserti TaxID=2268030 RepID=UPI000E649362|nr:ABC transporter permease [Dongia deserti]
MLKLLGQRLVLGILTLILVSALIFAVTEWLPGDIATNILGQQATPENVAAIRAELGLDRPPYERYVEWLRGAVDGDFGTSLANKRPVADVIGPRLWNTLFLAAYAALIAVPLSVFLGILAAIYRNSIYDRLVNISTLAAISMPEFFIGYILILFLAVQFRWFPAIATFKPEQTFTQHLYATFLPMLTLVLVVIAHMMRMTRTSVLTVMASPYIEMALLKGLSKARIVVRHALPNAMAPIINVIALNLAYLIVGVVVVEAVFTYNGLGRLMVDAVSKRDVPVVQACGLIFAVVFIGLNLIADVLSILSNPRLRHPR